MIDGATSTRKITLAGAPEFFDFPDGTTDGANERRFALLIFCDSDAQVRLLERDSPVVVGREEPSEIIIDDPSVSRQHARFTLKDAEVWVEDLDSRNGTFRRGQRLSHERLDAADEVIVGKARVVIAATRADGPRQPNADPDYVIVNPKMRQLYSDTKRAARADVPLLVLGETGSGKEHVARTFHRDGPRSEKPFVAVNCAAIPASLIESTLFGHERGAFTGALARSVGVFERASGGVLFLDEIGDLGMSAQAALLRALETRRITRVGGVTEIPVDVRLVAATHCDLEDMVDEGTFREDLYFRLNGIQVLVPPLRERPDEIEPLVLLVLAAARREWSVRAERVAPDAMDAIRRYSWPGNVRQLRHAVERAALLGDGKSITCADLPPYVFQVDPSPPLLGTEPHLDLALKPQLRRYERALIDEALRRAGGNRQMAAKLLRIPLRTLFRKLRTPGGRESEGNDAP